MTVIKDEFGCDRTFVTTRNVKPWEEVVCPFCNHRGSVLIRPFGIYKGEGIL